jgi:hypothetical protein
MGQQINRLPPLDTFQCNFGIFPVLGTKKDYNKTDVNLSIVPKVFVIDKHDPTEP